MLLGRFRAIPGIFMLKYSCIDDLHDLDRILKMFNYAYLRMHLLIIVGYIFIFPEASLRFKWRGGLGINTIHKSKLDVLAQIKALHIRQK